jgi:hypothetical protein
LNLAKNFSKNYLTTAETNPLSALALPGYPFFISAIGQNSQLAVIIIQIILTPFIALAMTRIILSNRGTQYTLPVFTICLIETSLLVQSFTILTETLFTFCSIGGFYFLNQARNEFRIKEIGLATIFFSFAAILRPVGVILILLFLFGLILKFFNQKTMLVLFVSALIINGLWVGRNFAIYDVPSISYIDSHNLHYYEGAGAVSHEKNIPLLEVQRKESDRMLKIIGTAPSLKMRHTYQRQRGIDLILENKKGFLEMHIIGVFKILAGPGQGEMMKVLSQGERVQAEKNYEKIILYLMVFITLTILTLAIIGGYKAKLSPIEKLMTLQLLLTLLITSGSQAYSRFRTPIAPIICYFASIGLIKLIEIFKSRRLSIMQ